MKKLFVMVAMLAVAATASAQWYAEGSVGFGGTELKPDTGDKSKTNNWNVRPAVGYYLNDKFDVGLGLNFSGSKDTPAVGNEIKGSAWGINPYARYSFFQFGKFETLARLGVNFGGGKTETTPVGGGTTTKVETTNWGLDLSPVLLFHLTEKVALSTTLNFARLNYGQTKVKDGSTTTNYGINANTGNVCNTGNILIGFSYSF